MSSVSGQAAPSPGIMHQFGINCENGLNLPCVRGEQLSTDYRSGLERTRRRHARPIRSRPFPSDGACPQRYPPGLIMRAEWGKSKASIRGDNATGFGREACPVESCRRSVEGKTIHEKDTNKRIGKDCSIPTFEVQSPRNQSR